jgi:vacuolar-type H+-ATPase subunit D/Vma8
VKIERARRLECRVREIAQFAPSTVEVFHEQLRELGESVERTEERVNAFRARSPAS